MSSIGKALSVFVRLTYTDTPTRRAPTNALRCGTLHYILGDGGRVGLANTVCNKIQGGRRGGRAPFGCDTKKGSPERRMTQEGVRAEKGICPYRGHIREAMSNSRLPGEVLLGIQTEDCGSAHTLTHTLTCMYV